MAVTRAVSRSIARCELTHLARQPIDLARARAQHEAYEEALAGLGCTLLRLPEEADLPDSVFVEDAAIVLDEVAVVTRPGAPSRRPETASVADALSAFRPLAVMAAPATLDGGDVVRMGRTLYVGLSSRTSEAGIAALRGIAAPFGYAVHGVPVTGCLHLKSAATAIGGDTVLVNPDWVDRGAFGAATVVEIDPAEPFAANALPIGGPVLFPAAFPRTRDRLAARGLDVVPLDISELAKAEGALTCCSLVFEVSGSGPGP